MQCMNAYSPITLSSEQTHYQRNTNCVTVGSEIPLPSHVKAITSTSNPFVKHCVKLRQSSSYRNSHSSVLVIGSTPLREILRFHESEEQKCSAIECLILVDEAEVPEEVDGLPVRVIRVSCPVMSKLCGLQSADSTQAIGLMRFPESFVDLSDRGKSPSTGESGFPTAHRILALDAIQDPGNLGTLLRTAMAFEWDGVYLLGGCCDPFNEKAVRASRGAAFQIRMVRGDWAHLEAQQIKMLAGHPSEGLHLSRALADSLAQTPFCFVLGSEGSGLSPRARKECQLVTIPMPAHYDSLNVSVAGGIFLHSLRPRTF